MDSHVDVLTKRREKLLKEVSDLTAQAYAEQDRRLTVEESTAVDERLSEVDGLETRIRAATEREQRAADLDASFRKITGGGPAVSDEFATWARARPGEGYDLNPTGADKRNLARLVETRGVETRSMSASGGVSSDSVYSQLFEYALQGSQLLNAGITLINTADGNSLPLPVVTAHAATSDTLTAANAALALADATVTTVNCTVAKYDYLTLVPTELIQDVMFDLTGYITRAAGRELGRRIAKQADIAYIAGFTTAGVTGPVGTTTSLGVQATAGMGTDLLVSLYHSVLPEYRVQSAGWVMSDAMAAIVRNLKASTGEVIWSATPDVSSAAEGAILGKSVYIDPFLPASAANAKTIYFGDWSALVVRVAGGIRFERSNDYAFGNDQVAYRAIVRTGAVSTDPNSVKYFAHSAT
jgi:HK97 family phage major capsid protein